MAQGRLTVSRRLVTLAAVAALALGCAPTRQKPSVAPPTPTPSGAPSVTLAVYGPPPVIRAYDRVVQVWERRHPSVQVTVRAYPDHAQAMSAFVHAPPASRPDVFLVQQPDLTGLLAAKAVRRVDDLLTEREIDFGDSYNRGALEAFSADAALQCMPADVSPLVVYYNPRLVEIDQVADTGTKPITQDTGWSYTEFLRAARAVRAPGVRGVAIAPVLDQVAPFLWSSGGTVVDNVTKPTTLTLSQGGAAGGLRKLLRVVRNPALTFSRQALERSSALQRFESGKLAMILGYRSLTPVLRAHQAFTFDVMPLPKLSKPATSAEMSGLCISSSSPHAGEAAGLVAGLVSDSAASRLAATGYVMPTNLDVVNSDAFLQTGQRPLHSEVFGRAVRDAQLLPSTPSWGPVRDLVTQSLEQFFYGPGTPPGPVVPDLQARLAALDQASVPIFDPTKATPTPTPVSTPSPGGSTRP